METETTIAQGLRVMDGESKYDEACKRLLSEKAILVSKATYKNTKKCLYYNNGQQRAAANYRILCQYR